MMGFVAFSLAETAYKFLIGQDWTRKLKDNFDDHQTRLLALEAAGFRTFDHFNVDNPAAQNDFDAEVMVTGAVSASEFTETYSVWLFKYNITARTMGAITRRKVQFNAVGLPITLTWRWKQSHDKQFLVGLKLLGNFADANGIWLERVDASNWRFVSYDGTRNSGVSFGNVAPGNWVKTKIVFTNDPSNRALCYVNDVLKDTLTLQLPTTVPLKAVAVCLLDAAGHEFFLDYVDFFSGGGVDAP
jgi:hypothetical protein